MTVMMMVVMVVVVFRFTNRDRFASGGWRLTRGWFWAFRFRGNHWFVTTAFYQTKFHFI
jgi:hypothetical protein